MSKTRYSPVFPVIKPERKSNMLRIVICESNQQLPVWECTNKALKPGVNRTVVIRKYYKFRKKARV